MSQQDIERNMWSDEEVYVLLGIWCDATVMGKLDGTCRNAQVYKEIVKRMGDKGFVRTVSQIKYKMKNLKKDYRKLVDHNNRSGRQRKTMKFEEELSVILGDRPSANPVCVMEAGSVSLPEDTQTVENDDEDEDAASASTISYVGEEIDIESDSQESTNVEDEDSPQGPPPTGPPSTVSPPPGSASREPQPVSEPTESTPGPSGTRQRKRPSSGEAGGSQPKQHVNTRKSMLDDLQKVIQKSDDRFFQEERRRVQSQREDDEKWHEAFLSEGKRVVDSLTNFMTFMSGTRDRGTPAPGTAWPESTPMPNVLSQVRYPYPSQPQPSRWHYSSSRIGSAFGYVRPPPEGPFASSQERADSRDASTPGMSRPIQNNSDDEPRFTRL